MKKLKLSLLFILLLSPAVLGQAPTFQKERRFFDFLVGDWKLDSAETASEKWTSGTDTFSFKSAIDGNAITSEWYFNRGTPAKPNFARAVYYMGFDNSSRSWTFYYVSPQSAQFFQGRYENDNWYFYKTFVADGKNIEERQSWIAVGKDAPAENY